MATRIGIDTGGTFTDVVRWSRGRLLVHKLPSTPEDPALAVLAGIEAVRSRPGELVDVVHGTTVGLNAVLEGRLPRTVFVTNRGFVDLIEIGRQERTDLYALEPDRKAPPVARDLRVEVDCRRGKGGEILVPLRTREIQKVVRQVVALRPEAIAIGLLHSPVAPQDEQALERALQRAMPDVPVTCSAALWPALGEYERFTAAILNAAITPLVSSYTSRLQQRLGNGQLRLLRSSTGILPAEEAQRFPARAMFSGPAGGVLATQRLCEALGLPRAAAFDMGGTSTDVCLVERRRLHTDQGQIAGLPLPLPSVDVHTVGCGGGSLAYCDRGGALRVGPESAGAMPGPACYGVGTEPTVTDAHVALGHLGADTLLGGGFRIDPDRSVRAIERLAKKLSLSPRRTAEGILAVADVTMRRALMRITGERAVDPASVPLVAYGGAGGLHAASLSAQLGMPGAWIPIHPGAFSALGLALAGDSVESTVAVLQPWSERNERSWRQQAKTLCREAAARLGGRGANAKARVLVRYRGQGGGLYLELGRRALPSAFAQLHRERFGFVAIDTPLELVQISARAERKGRPLPPLSAGDGGKIPPTARRRRAPLGGSPVRFLRREDLPLRTRIEGPCILEEATAATRLPASFAATVTKFALQVHRSIY